MLKIYAADVSEKDYTASAEGVMSAARLEKYNKITDPALRRQSAAVAHLLRKALGEKEETYDAAGRPVAEGCFLSIAHSGRWALVAISDSPVGVDIEGLRAEPKGVAARMFTQRERDLGLDFFELWVRKESMLKKLGLGLGGRQHEIIRHKFLAVGDFEGYAAALCTDENEYELEII